MLEKDLMKGQANELNKFCMFHKALLSNKLLLKIIVVVDGSVSRKGTVLGL